MKTVGNYDFVISEWLKQELPEARTPHVKDRGTYFRSSGMSGHTGSRMFFRGDTIYSYHDWWPIARLLSDKCCLLNVERYSVTTSAHTSQVKSALLRADYRIFQTCKNVPLEPDPSYLLDEFKKAHQTALHARDSLLWEYCNPVKKLREAQKQYLAFCQEFTLPIKYDLTEDDWKTIALRVKRAHDRRELKQFAKRLLEGKE